MGMDRPIEKKKWTLKKLAYWGLTGLFLVFVVYLLVFKTGGASLKVEKERITIAVVKNGPFQDYIPVISSVMPENSIYLDAVEGGRVETIYLEAGSLVKKGDKILKLSNTNLLMTMLNNEAQVNRAANDLRATRLQMERNRLELQQLRNDADYTLEKTEREYTRKKNLFQEEFISRKEYEEAEAEYLYLKKKRALTIETQEQNLKFQEEQVKELEVSVNRMQASLDILKQQLENLTVRAPIPGQLTSLMAEVGQSKSPGERLGQIDEAEGFKVRADIDEHYISRIAVGLTGKADFNGKPIQLKVTKVFPEVKEGKFVVDMQFLGQEPDGIRRGQTLHVRLQLSEESTALLLERGGFFETTGGNWVFLVDPSGKTALKRPVRLGRQNPDYFEVLDGLKPGDQVITSSYENFGQIGRLVLK